jgi:hypothetical protein
MFHFEPKSADEREAIDRFVKRSDIVFRRWTDKLRRGVPAARVLYFPDAGHFVHMTREVDVLREIHAFIAEAPAAN